jgi:hypothetical protein
MPLFWKWVLGAAIGLVLIAFTILSVMAGSPKDAYGMLRYALPYMHSGTLKIGDAAPDVRLVELDGVNHFHVNERIGDGKPLVLVFGSFT